MARGTTQMEFGDMEKVARWLWKLRTAVIEDKECAPTVVDSEIRLLMDNLNGRFELARVSEWKRSLRGRTVLPASEMGKFFHQIGDLQAADPRDHVYGVLSGFEKHATSVVLPP